MKSLYFLMFIIVYPKYIKVPIPGYPVTAWFRGLITLDWTLVALGGAGPERDSDQWQTLRLLRSLRLVRMLRMIKLRRAPGTEREGYLWIPSGNLLHSEAMAHL